MQGSKLTFSFWSQLATEGKIWSPDRKFWSPTYFIHNLRKNTILYVTLHQLDFTKTIIPVALMASVLTQTPFEE